MSISKTAVRKTAALSPDFHLRAMALANRVARKRGYSEDSVSVAVASFGGSVPDGKSEVWGACEAALINTLVKAHIDECRRESKYVAYGDASDVGGIAARGTVEYVGGTAREAVGSHVGAALKPDAPDACSDVTDADLLATVLAHVSEADYPFVAALAQPAYGQRVRPGIGAILRAAGMPDAGSAGVKARAAYRSFVSDLRTMGETLTVALGPDVTARSTRPIVRTRDNVTYPGGTIAVDGRGPQIGWHHGASTIPVYPVNGIGRVTEMDLPAVPFVAPIDSPARSFDAVKGVSAGADGIGTGMRVGYASKAGTGRTSDAMFTPRTKAARIANEADRLARIARLCPHGEMVCRTCDSGLDHMPSWVGSAPDALPAGAIRALPDGTPVYA